MASKLIQLYSDEAATQKAYPICHEKGVFDSEGNESITAIKTALGTKVDKVTGKGLSTNDYTTTEKNKLGNIEAGANKTIVDSALSGTSTNPVQNKVIKGVLDTHQSNILYALDNGAKNLLKIIRSDASSQAAISDDGSITVNHSAVSGNFTIHFFTDDNDSVGYKPLPTEWIGKYFSGVTTYVEGATLLMEFSDNGITWSDEIGVNSPNIKAKIPSTHPYYRFGLKFNSQVAVTNYVLKPMIADEVVYNTVGANQPPALPNYDLTRLEAEDRAELVELVDSGAKQLVDLSNAGSGTHNAVTFTNLGNNVYKVNGTPSASDTHLDIMGTWSSVPSFLSNNVGKTIVFSTNHDHIYYGIIPIVGGSPLEYVGGNKSTPVAYTIPSNLSGALLRIYVDTNHTYSNVNAELLACTKAAFGVSNKFVPYRPNYDLVCDSVIDLNDMISSFTVNSSKSVSIKLRRDGSFTMLMFGFVQTIGKVHWYIESNTSTSVSVIDAMTGSAVSQSVISFAYSESTAILTISANVYGNCNFVLIRSAY